MAAWRVCTRWNARRNFTSTSRSGAIDGIVRHEADAARAIIHRTEITRDHMTPEIQLFLLTPNCALYHAPYERMFEMEGREEEWNVFAEPFWSIYWPGGQALTRFVLDEGRNLFRRVKSPCQVLDVGAGCGATAIAAKLTGAGRAVANDIDKVACVAASMNAALNGVRVEATHENLLNEPPEESTNVIFLGDMLYDEELACTLIPWLEKARGNGSEIYLGDPGRHGLTDELKKRLRIVKRYELPENVRRENYGYDVCDIWQFRG